jgi:hypothetical protein
LEIKGLMERCRLGVGAQGGKQKKRGEKPDSEPMHS